MQSGTRNSTVKKLIVTAILIAVSSVSTVAQDAQKGKAVANVCLACHSIAAAVNNTIMVLRNMEILLRTRPRPSD